LPTRVTCVRRVVSSRRARGETQRGDGDVGEVRLSPFIPRAQMTDHTHTHTHTHTDHTRRQTVRHVCVAVKSLPWWPMTGRRPAPPTSHYIRVSGRARRMRRAPSLGRITQAQTDTDAARPYVPYVVSY